MPDVVEVDPDVKVYLVSCVRQRCRRCHIFEQGRPVAEAIAILEAGGWRQLTDPFTAAAAENGDPVPACPLPPYECPDHAPLAAG